ncbi:helix-turn-helix domain-containing protein [Desulfolutivibrio sulfoxidireducens]|nr:helix-turn-helix domain-containing protein [Desulfolutivibrio sulfoxidireducens]
MVQAIIGEKEAAAYVGLSVKTLQTRRMNHLPPVFVKIGRSVRYRLEDLDAFVTAHVVDPSKAA